ncbi:DEHA2B11506p-like protein, partial [Metarhizium majus ARSEF 297]
MMVLAAYMTRGLQLVLGATKRSENVERGDNMGRRGHDEIPLHQRRADSDDIASPPQLRLQQHHYSQSSPADGSAAASSSSSLPDYPAQAPPPPARCALCAARLASHLDASIFALVLLAGIPVYYAAGYAMPLHVAVTTLCYRLALATPGPWQRYLHPVLTASLLAVLVIWPLSLAHGSGLTAALRSYKTGANYTRLWRREPEPGPPLLPGAGDVFSTVLDASIVSLALPMFQYRRELKRHLATLAIPNVLISVGSVLSYPPVCRAIGIAPTRSLAFASRSLTLALATPATTNLGGDAHTVAALAIASGILGVLVADKMMRLLRIPDDDYVTRGITLGVNSSAIGTALLLRTDPRAAALSSLSMTLFGTVTVLLTSIPPVATMIRALVGL